MDFDDEKNLDELTTELIEAAHAGNKNWLDVGKSIFLVKTGRKFEEKGYKNITKWLNTIAIVNKLQISTLWNCYRAFKVLREYNARHPEKEVDKNAKGIDMGILCLIDQIAQNTTNPDKLAVKDSYIEKVTRGDATRADLTKTLDLMKGFKKKRKARGQAEESASDIMKAENVVEALMNQVWLIGEPKPNRGVMTKYDRPQWELFTEFPVNAGTTKKVRRMDALIIENQLFYKEFESYHHVYLHGIEIKVSQLDLENDHKMQEYTPYVDFFYIAVPEELVSVAEEYRLPTWGLIAIKKEVDNRFSAKLVEKASLRMGERRDETLEFAVLKLI